MKHAKKYCSWENAMKKGIILMVGYLFIAAPVYSGWFDDAVRSVGESLGNRAVNEAGNSAYEGAKLGAKDVVSPNADNKRRKDGNNSDTPSPPQSAGQKSAAGADAGGGSLTENEQVYSKYDFVPGETVLFYDDFSDTDIGEFPRKWHLKGPKEPNNNAVEVVSYQGKRLMRSQPASGGENQNPSTQYIRLNQKGDLPEKFTLEFDANFIAELDGGYKAFYNLYLLKDDSNWPGNDSPTEGTFFFNGNQGQSKNTKTGLKKSDNKLHHIAVSVNGTFVKAYVDNVRVINDPEGVERPIRLVGISMGIEGGSATDKIMIGTVRLAAGGKELKSALDIDGKIVTHGILFDTGKDVIKAESLPTLKMILGILVNDPELKFSIEGHTDNQGNKGINQPLSEKRSAAVKKWLTGKGIATARLKTKGLGDSKPLDSNKTTEGRANNRRVEFVTF
jgi:outer membrane protein OmpA-like peptidoglycan-associated protein